MVEDISHEGLRTLLRREGVTFQRLKTWKTSKDPRYQEKKVRIEHLYAIADREVAPRPGDPQVVICVDEFGPLNLQPRPGRQWAAVSGKGKEPGRAPRRRQRATYTRSKGVRHALSSTDDEHSRAVVTVPVCCGCARDDPRQTMLGGGK